MKYFPFILFIFSLTTGFAYSSPNKMEKEILRELHQIKNLGEVRWSQKIKQVQKDLEDSRKWQAPLIDKRVCGKDFGK